MAGSLLPEPKQQFFNDIGVPLFAGKIYTYAAGTLTPKATYQDQALTILNTNPVIANARGEVVMYGAGAYRVILKDAFDNTIYDRDNISIIDFSGPNGADQIGNGGESVAQSLNALQMADYAQLRGYSGPRKQVYVTGYLVSASPSGIAGSFVASPNDTNSIDNGGTIIVASNGMRWKRQYTGLIEVDWFGAYGVADSAPAITSAIAYADTVQGNIGFRPGSTYTLASGITWNSTRVGMNGRGCTLATNFSSGVLLRPTQSGIDVNERIGSAFNHPFENFNLYGPGFANSNVVAMRIEDLSSDAVNAGNIIRSVAFKRFAVNLQYGRGCFCTLVESCNFQGTQGAGVDAVNGIQIESAVNSGERNIFRGCFIGGRNLSFNQNNGNADTYFEGCSFVFCGQAFVILSAGSVSINASHIEADTDVARWFQVSGPNSIITVSGGGNLLYGGNKPNFAPFYTDSTCTNGGVVIRDLNIISGGRVVGPRLIDGTGRAVCSGIKYSSNDNHSISSDYENLLSYPSFESAQYTVDWTLGGTVPAVRTNTITAHTGTYSLMMAPLPGNPTPSNAAATVPCRAGQFAACEFWYNTIGLAGSGGTFQGTFSFVDRAGNFLGTLQQTMAVTTDSSGWTRVNAYMPLPAPQGTYGVTMGFNLFGTSSGTPKGYIDDVIITAS